MPKTWEQMTQAEKIEELRRDFVTLLNAYNDLTRRLEASAGHLGQAVTTANEAAGAVAVLQARLNSGEIASQVENQLASEIRRQLPPRALS